MEVHKVVHKTFLFGMFLVCVIAVVSFARSKVEAADAVSNYISPTPSTDISQTYNSTVGTALDKTTTTATSNMISTQPATISSSPTTTTTSNTATTTSGTKTVSPEDSAKAAADTAELILSGSAGTSSSDTKTQTTATTTNNKATEPSTTNSIKVVQDSSVTNDAPVTTIGTESATKDIAVQVEDLAKTSQVQVFTMPTVMKASELAQEKNPKISGATTADISVDNVKLINKYDGQKTLLFEGKSTPNNVFNIFIFSNDPIVMTVKADENGKWSYELTRELNDGQHEVFVAVTEKNGKIVSKAEPLAFVKTAEAATVIPVSELDENKSPMQKSTTRYILIAISIMSVCLAIALALIGILNHKYKSDEATF